MLSSRLILGRVEQPDWFSPYCYRVVAKVEHNVVLSVECGTQDDIALVDVHYIKVVVALDLTDLYSSTHTEVDVCSTSLGS